MSPLSPECPISPSFDATPISLPSPPPTILSTYLSNPSPGLLRHRHHYLTSDPLRSPSLHISASPMSPMSAILIVPRPEDPYRSHRRSPPDPRASLLPLSPEEGPFTRVSTPIG